MAEPSPPEDEDAPRPQGQGVAVTKDRFGREVRVREPETREQLLARLDREGRHHPEAGPQWAPRDRARPKLPTKKEKTWHPHARLTTS